MDILISTNLDQKGRERAYQRGISSVYRSDHLQEPVEAAVQATARVQVEGFTQDADREEISDEE